MSSPRRNKNIGRTVQKEVVKKLHQTFSDLQEDDVRNLSMGATGEDILLSPLARKYFPFSVEVKYRASWSILQHMDQARGHNTKYPPIVVFRKARDKLYCVLEFDELLTLLKRVPYDPK